VTNINKRLTLQVSPSNANMGDDGLIPREPLPEDHFIKKISDGYF